MRLRLATLNVWGLPAPISRDPLARIERIGDALSGLEPDVLCFQEVWTGAARDILLDAARASGLPHHWHRVRRSFDSGLVIASRWPIQSAQFRRFRLRGLPQRLQHGDYYAGKGVAVVSLATPAGPVAVANTHLHAAYARDHEESEYRAQRSTQAIELALALAPLRAPLIAAGDLNLEEHERAFAVLLGLAQCRDSAAELDAREATSAAANPYRSRDSGDQRIDYVLCRDGVQRAIETRVVERCFDRGIRLDDAPGETDAAYSDHYGVAATFEIGAPQQRTARNRFAPNSGIAPDSIAAALALLDQSRRDTRARQRSDRNAALASAGVGVVAFAARRRITRRGLLRAAAGVGAFGGAAFAAGLLGLSEGLDSQDLRACDAIENELKALASQASTAALDSDATRFWEAPAAAPPKRRAGRSNC